MKDEAKHALVPKLRFPEFHGAWEKKTIETVGHFTGGGTPSKDNAAYWTGDIPWISSSDLNEDSISQINISRFITKQAVQESATKLVPAKSILLISRVGVGKLAVSTFPLCTSQDFTNFTPTDADPLFLAYLLKSQKETLLSFNQGTSIKGFTKDNIASLRLGFPSPAEQQKIAACLSSVDELMAARARKVDALKTHKKGLMQQLFPREGETQPRLRFPEFENAGEWEQTNLGNYFDPIRNGFVGTATPYYTTSDGVRYLQGRNIKQGRIQAENLIYITNEFHSRQRKSHLKEGDILMVQSGHVGECAVVGSEFVGCNCHALIILSPKRKLSSEFFALYFYSPIGELAIFQITTGNTIKHILASELKTLPVLVPSLAEQQRIASCLSSLDALITAETQKLEALKTHKKGLMQQLFPSPEEVKG